MGAIKMMSQQPENGNRDLSVAYYHANQLGSFQDVHRIRRMHGPRRVITFCLLTAVLPTVLLVIPLYLRHSVYADVSYQVTESDVLEMVEGMSSVFCQEHSLKMNSTFSAYQLDGEPELSTERKHVHMKKSMYLPDDTLEYWGFYLLEGSSVVVTVCSRYEGGRIMLVRGERNLKTCGLLQHNLRQQKTQQGGGHVGKEMSGGSNVRVMFENKHDMRLEDARKTSEVEEIARKAGNPKLMKEFKRIIEEEERALMGGGGEQRGDGMRMGEVGGLKGSKVEVDGDGHRGGVGSGRERVKKGEKVKLGEGIMKEHDDDFEGEDDDDDDDDKDDGEEDDDDDDNDDDDENEDEHSGQGGVEHYDQQQNIKPSSKEETKSNEGQEGTKGDKDTSKDHTKVFQHEKKKLNKLGALKSKEFDVEDFKQHKKRSAGRQQGVGELKAGRLERLQKDLEGGNEGIVKRREKREEVRLLDTGLKHGGTAIGYIKRESEEDSDSSFEMGLKECYGGLIEHHQSFEPSQTCTEEVAGESTDIDGLEVSKNSLRFVYDIEESGYYYFIFYSDNDRVTNKVHAAFDIHKTVYDYGGSKTANSSVKCINATECTFAVGFLSGTTVMVEIPHKDGIDRDVMDELGGPQGALLISSCHPRMSVYIVFPIAVLFLILGCAFL